MAKVIMETSSAKLVTDNGVELEVKFTYDLGTSSGLPFIEGRLYVDKEFKATFIRVKAAGDKLAADFPGCDSDYVVVDENGSITNG